MSKQNICYKMKPATGLLGLGLTLLLCVQLADASFEYFKLEPVSGGEAEWQPNRLITLKESDMSGARIAKRSISNNINSNNNNNNNNIMGNTNNVIARNQRRTNQVGVGLELDLFDRMKLLKLLRMITRRDRDQEQGQRQSSYMNKGRSQVRTNRILKRTVESPALSVDTGGRPPSRTGISGELSKLWNTKQGHYTDIYEQFDYPKFFANSSTTSKRPADAVEDLMREHVIADVAGQEFEQKLKEKEKEQNKKPNRRLHSLII